MAVWKLLLARLADSTQHETIASETVAGLPHRWEDIVIAESDLRRTNGLWGTTFRRLPRRAPKSPLRL